MNTDKFLDDVALAETLLEKAAQNTGVLTPADDVFSLKNFIKMKY